ELARKLGEVKFRVSAHEPYVSVSDYVYAPKFEAILTQHISRMLEQATADLEARNEMLMEWREQTKHLCGCEMDEHDTVCLVHYPAKVRLEQRTTELRGHL